MFIHVHYNAGREQSLAEANKQSSVEWRGLSEEERKKYIDEAATSTAEDVEINTKKQCAKILSHLNDLVCLVH